VVYSDSGKGKVNEPLGSDEITPDNLPSPINKPSSDELRMDRIDRRMKASAKVGCPGISGSVSGSGVIKRAL